MNSDVEKARSIENLVTILTQNVVSCFFIFMGIMMYLGTYELDIESDRMLVVSGINMGFTIFNYITMNYFISNKIQKAPEMG